MTTESTPVRGAGRPGGWRWSGEGVLALGLATLLTITGVGLLGAGAPALWVDQQQRDRAGFVTSDARLLSTPTSALVVTPLDVALDRPVDGFLLERWLGDVRVQVRAPSQEALFVGLGRADAVAGYLDDVAVDQLRELVVGTPVQYDRQDGRSAASPPGRQDLWSESVSGTGRLDLDWTVRDGRWALVVMHPDGHAGVQAELSVGATLPALTWVASGMALLGTLFLVGGLALLVALALPDRPRRPGRAAGGASVPSPRTGEAGAAGTAGTASGATARGVGR